MAVAAMVFVGAFASASASAAAHYLVCAEVAGTGHWKDSLCSEATTGGNWETKEVSAALEVEGTSGVSELATEIGSTKVTILCKKDKFVGTIEASGKSKATITYEECSLVGASGCTVKSPAQAGGVIIAAVLDKLVEVSGVILDEFFEKEEEGAKVPFTTIEITGCALNGTFKVTGTQKCELPKGETFLKLHEIECLTSGSTLKFGPTKTATYKGNASIQLKDHNAWKVSK